MFTPPPRVSRRVSHTNHWSAATFAIQDNLESLTLELSEKQVQRLNEASAIELGFPYDFYERELVKNMVYGGLRDQILSA